MLTNNEIIRAKSIIKSEGGYREKELLKSKIPLYAGNRRINLIPAPSGERQPVKAAKIT